MYQVIKLFLTGIAISTFMAGYGNTLEIPGKFRSCHQVFEQLIHSIGRANIPKPVFVPENNKRLTAKTLANGEIHIGDKFIDVCRGFGKDSLNAMALVLGHELAHYYLDHFWATEYGSEFANLAWGKKIMETFEDTRFLESYESQADEFGIFYCFLAGYSTFDIASEVYDKIYSEYNLPDSIAGYPSKSDRIKIHEQSESRIKKLIPVFETGILLTVLGSDSKSKNRSIILSKAVECFEFILDENYTNKEILNNTATIHIMLALMGMEKSETRFSYPLTLDEDSQLYGLKGAKATGQKTSGFGTKEFIKEQLYLAEKYLNRARELDRDYIPAFINLACLYDLLDENEDAAFWADKAIRLAGKSNNMLLLSNAQVIKGIIEAGAAKMIKADSLFMKATIGGNNTIAQYNHAVLNGNDPSEDQKKKTIGFGVNNKKELINGKDLKTLVKESDYYRKENLHVLKDGSRIFKFDEGDGELYIVECDLRECTFQDLVFYQVKINGGIETARGIKSNDPLERVRKLYGNPSFQLISNNHQYWVFKESGLIFKIGRNNMVTGWVNYYFL